MYRDMWSEVKGSVPNLPTPYAKTCIQRAWADICRQNLWSFQVYEANWISPTLLDTGLATTVQGSNQVVLDATAAAALIANLASVGGFNPVNQRQFRIGVSTVYNINEFDGTDTLTLDRGWAEASAAGTQYMLYQVYYPAPYKDHLSFVSIRDMVNFTDLVLTNNRAWLDEQDPQRTWYYFPTNSVFYRLGIDPDNTATYQFPIFELWGVPLTNRAYQLYGIRRGVDFTRDTDVLPPAVTEEALVARAKVYAYEWGEANASNMERSRRPDYKFLMKETMANYTRLYKDLRRRDRETVDLWFSIRRSSLYGKYYAQYNTVSGTAYPGVYLG